MNKEKKTCKNLVKNKNDNKSKKKSDSVSKKSNGKKKNNFVVKSNFKLSFLDLLIVIVITIIISSLITGFIINNSYKKNFIINNYMNDDNIKEFFNIYNEIKENFYEEVDESAMIRAATDGMLKFLKDNYSIYLDESESSSLNEQLDGSYEGIGIVAIDNVVYSVYDNSPAAEAGIKKGDIIVEINDNEIKEGMDISKFILSDKANKIVVKRNNKKFEYSLKKSNVVIPSTTIDVIKSVDKKKNIGYISLNTFSSLSFDEFYSNLIKLEKDKKIDSLIIDLRNNTGGYLNIASNISSLFLKQDKIIYSLQNKDSKKEYKDDNKEERNYKIVVLVNEKTASAAEVLTAALHDSYDAIIVGKKTYGKGKVQTMKEFNGSIVKYTSAKWLRPNGECVDKVGIEPDYEIDVIYENNVFYDKQLDKAIDLLS